MLAIAKTNHVDVTAYRESLDGFIISIITGGDVRIWTNRLYELSPLETDQARSLKKLRMQLFEILEEVDTETASLLLRDLSSGSKVLSKPELAIE